MSSGQALRIAPILGTVATHCAIDGAVERQGGVMLVLTDSARTAIESILAGSSAAEASGLRISANPEDATALRVDVATGPSDGDTVIEDSGTRVFLQPAAATILDDKILDAVPGPAGTVNLQVSPQG